MLVPALASPHAHNTAHSVFSSWFWMELLSSFLGKCFVRLVFVLCLGMFFFDARFRTGFWSGFWSGFFRGWFSYAFLVRFFKRLVFVRVFGQVFKEARFRAGFLTAARFRTGFQTGI